MFLETLLNRDVYHVLETKCFSLSKVGFSCFWLLFWVVAINLVTELQKEAEKSQDLRPAAIAI